MAYQPHTLVSFGGELNVGQTPSEIWQCNVRVVDQSNAGPVNDTKAYMGEIATPLSTWFHGLTRVSANTTLTWLKANAIGADGKYSSDVTNVHDYSPGTAGGSAASVVMQPDILGARFTWTTAYSRGPGHEGGIFMPTTVITPEVNGSIRILAADVTAMISSAKGLLTVLANQAGTNKAIPCVLSKINGSYRTITGVKIGNVMTVQRRRKDAVKPVYTASNWP